MVVTFHILVDKKGKSLAIGLQYSCGKFETLPKLWDFCFLWLLPALYTNNTKTRILSLVALCCRCCRYYSYCCWSENLNMKVLFWKVPFGKHSIYSENHVTKILFWNHLEI